MGGVLDRLVMGQVSHLIIGCQDAGAGEYGVRDRACDKLGPDPEIAPRERGMEFDWDPSRSNPFGKVVRRSPPLRGPTRPIQRRGQLTGLLREEKEVEVARKNGPFAVVGGGPPLQDDRPESKSGRDLQDCC